MLDFHHRDFHGVDLLLIRLYVGVDVDVVPHMRGQRFWVHDALGFPVFVGDECNLPVGLFYGARDVLSLKAMVFSCLEGGHLRVDSDARTPRPDLLGPTEKI